MLSAIDIERIAQLWVPDEWPTTADTYAIACHRNPFAYYVERIRHLGLTGSDVLDASCGSGRWSFALATAFDRVVGFDLNERRLATAFWLKDRFEIPSVRFIQGGISRVSAADASADAIHGPGIIVSGAIGIDPILSECARVLRPGGVCYLSLNGPGYGYELAKRTDPKVAALGQRRIYNTYCQRYLAGLAADLGSGGERNTALRDGLRGGKSPAELLADLGEPAASMAAEAIDRDLGRSYTVTLVGDLSTISAGRGTGFSHDRGGRDFEPEEVRDAARAVGFDRVEWALEGCLSLRPDGSVHKGPSPKARPNPGEFDGRIRIFEVLLWKP